MRRIFLSALFVAFAVTAFADPKDDVVKAAKALAEKPNYSWRSTAVVPESARFKPGPTEGKREKNGLTYLMISFGNSSIEAFLEGEKSIVKNQEGEWRSTAELENSEGPARFMGRMLRNYRTPA